MLFNTWAFACFLPIVFALYWMLPAKRLGWQNALLLLASYFFYACWDWRFLFLLLFSTGLDYFAGLKIANSGGAAKKFWFWLSVTINLGFLGVFKYYNFFVESFAGLISNFGFRANIETLEVILPVGISFYTFHGLSYVIDIYKNRIAPEVNPVTYSLFVSYFPLLVAGPIERATHLLPQLKRERKFEYEKAVDGIYQILWGLFKKAVIADSCAEYANVIFEHTDQANSLSLALGAVYFAFQIYGDFSGYSDIAIGTSKLFGIDLLRNFNYPYFSRDIAEFWRRWHISLSSWFRDYVYIPLGGSKGGSWMKIRNVFAIFVLSGFWHGANWTFIVWGVLNALFFLPLLLRSANRNNMHTVAEGRSLPTLLEFFSICLTFALASFAWIFFRAKDLPHALSYIGRMFSMNFDEGIQFFSIERYSAEMLLLIGPFVLVEWFSRSSEHPIRGNYRFAKAMLVIISIALLGTFYNVADFIYFQF